MLLNAPESLRCRECRRSLDPDWIDAEFSLSQTQWDVSYTYDGYCIVSARFRDVVGEREAHYLDLPSQPDFFALFADGRVAFDVERRGTRFENFCRECGRYRDIAGATPAFLKPPLPRPDELRRTDVEFGSGEEQSPLLIVGADLADELRGAGLSGLDLRAVAA